MKRFGFRLDSVLDYRRQVEKQKQILLGEVRQRVAFQERALWEASTTLVEARENLRRQESVGEIDVARAQQHRWHIGSLVKRLSELTMRLRMLEIELSRRRDEAVRAQKERKVLEMLRARCHARYLRKAERTEQNELDDLAAKNQTIRRTGSQECTTWRP
jgi:flagellar export protein FliJ